MGCSLLMLYRLAFDELNCLHLTARGSNADHLRDFPESVRSGSCQIATAPHTDFRLQDELEAYLAQKLEKDGFVVVVVIECSNDERTWPSNHVCAVVLIQSDRFANDR